MPPPTTLLDYADGEVTRHETALADAGADLTSARGELRDAREQALQASDDLGEARRDAAEARAALAAMDTAADAGPLVEALGDAIEAARAAGAGLLEARRLATEAALRAAAAERRVSRARSRLEEARAVRAAAAADRDRRQDVWGPRLAAPPLSTVAGPGGDADDVLGGTAYGERQSELGAALPAALRDAAEKRRELEMLRGTLAAQTADHARDVEDGLRQASGEPDGLAAPEATAHARARAALEDFLRRARGIHDAAVAFLAEEMPALSEGEETRIADLATDGAAAAGLQATLTEATKELERRRAALRQARLDALADPSVDVSAAEAAVAGAESDESDARDAFETGDHPENLEAWEAAVPDVVWDWYLRFLRHTEGLEWLRDDVTPTDLENDLDAAEAALAAALFDAAEARERRAALEDARLEDEALREAREEAYEARARSALKGES